MKKFICVLNSIELIQNVQAILFRPLWGWLTKFGDAATLQFAWMIPLLLSQVILALATETWMFCVGMIMFSCGVSGYSGLKFVLHYDMVGGKHMQYIITFVKGLQFLKNIFCFRLKLELYKKSKCKKSSAKRP